MSSADPQVKRKPSREANIAERRGTHNAVESQTRDSQRLNRRFPDLAALLADLSQIRRVLSSQQLSAFLLPIFVPLLVAVDSRELRLLKLEADVLRRGLNEWR